MTHSPLKVVLQAISHRDHRYPTIGDWFVKDDGELHAHVSTMGNWKYELLVAIHELVEMALCVERGIKESDVTAFDVQFENERAHDHVEGEPGDDMRSPYRREHRFAETIERLVAHELGVDWQAYEDTLENL